jgi:argininosuccinate lyase
MKLWAQGYELDPLVEQFTVGEDYLLDQKLVPFDCIASYAHATMLESIGILTASELNALHGGLADIVERHRLNNFVISVEQEDCHTAIENFLVEHCGEVGKKIHTARSRNDQVLVALRLYMKTQILQVIDQCCALTISFLNFANNHADVAIPGRTHMQLAMPSSFGLWAGALAESLNDDTEMLKNAYAIIDQCPLGSASSYGTAVAIDRQKVSMMLGFKKVQNNVLYANNSRGKFEAVVIQALHQVMLSLSKASSDLMFFGLPEVGYLALPEKLCSGSSLMPQKRNPCALELVRAKSSTTASLLSQVYDTIRTLPSGYHRDFQETKAPLMKAFEISLLSIHIILQHIEGLKVNHENCHNAFRPELFATDEALALSLQGVPFRDAYLKVANAQSHNQPFDPKKNIATKTHLGASGNLGLELAMTQADNLKAWSKARQKDWEELWARFSKIR